VIGCQLMVVDWLTSKVYNVILPPVRVLSTVGSRCLLYKSR